MRLLHLTRSLDERGVATIEFGFVLPVLLLMAFGIIDFGRAVWFQATLDYAVQAAARCGAINATACPTSGGSFPTLIQQYAVSQAFALGLDPGNPPFTVTTGATCASGVTGVKVATTSPGVPFTYFFPLFAGYSGTLSASACYPT